MLKAADGLNCNILLVGSGEKFDQLKKLNNLKNVHFAKNISDAEKNVLLNLCFGFILPSTHRSEAFGIVLLEASAHKKPLIT